MLIEQSNKVVRWAIEMTSDNTQLPYLDTQGLRCLFPFPIIELLIQGRVQNESPRFIGVFYV